MHAHASVCVYICTCTSVYLYMCVCRRRQNQSHQFSGVFPASPLLLITIDLAVIVYFLFLSFVCHQLHMVVVCINSYVVHICVCNLSSLISAQSQQKGTFRMLLRAIPPLPSGYRELAIFSHAYAIIALLNAPQHNHQHSMLEYKRAHTHTAFSDIYLGTAELK